MKIKICGITCLEDAMMCIEAGADLLGFNFYPPSPRFVSPDQCAQILRGLPHPRNGLKTIGVFVNESPKKIAEVLDLCGLDQAQLSGDEPVEAISVLGSRAFKAIRPRSLETGIDEAAKFARPGGFPALLVDAYQPHQYGGTGLRADWQSAQELARRFPILLAGGLNAENVAAALAQVSPAGVDVASGVESLPGRKDRSKVMDFIQAARSANGRSTNEH